ncbi:MAG: hypothetical protein J3K34DRAFT_516373 [Monoraphidium minutum]|nr:MAG: hypothetical protein J3K34DRAFT_516373 [Monoraphidium minutum]
MSPLRALAARAAARLHRLPPPAAAAAAATAPRALASSSLAQMAAAGQGGRGAADEIADLGARADEAAAQSEAAERATAAAARAGFDVPRSGPAAAEAPTPGAAAGMGLGGEWMRGMVDVVAGAAAQDAARVAKGVEEMGRDRPAAAPPARGVPFWRLPRGKIIVEGSDEDIERSPLLQRRARVVRTGGGGDGGAAAAATRPRLST